VTRFLGFSDKQQLGEASPERLAKAQAGVERARELLNNKEFEESLRPQLEALGHLGFRVDQRVLDAARSVFPQLVFEDSGSQSRGVETDAVIAHALFGVGGTLSQLGLEDAGFAALDQVVACFGESEQPRVRVFVGLSYWRQMDALFRSGSVVEAAIALQRALGYEELVRFKQPKAVLVAVVRLCFELGRLGRVEDELALCDDAVRIYGSSEDPEVRAGIQTVSVDTAFRLGQLGRMEEANATYAELRRRYGTFSTRVFEDAAAIDYLAYVGQDDAERLFRNGDVSRAIEWIKGAFDRLRPLSTPVALRRKIDCLIALARYLQELGDCGSADVVCSRALETFGELPELDRDQRSLGQAIHALLLDVISTNLLRSGSRVAAMERLTRILQNTPTDTDARQKLPSTPRERDLAKQLAELQASDWPIRIRMADNEPATLEEMRGRALSLYRAGGPWFEFGFTDPGVDGRAVGAAMLLQTTGDAYALLSREWTDKQREQLPLPSPAVTEQRISQIGLADWAQGLGHPLPRTHANDLLEPPPVRVGGSAPNLVAAFETAMTHQEILNRVYRSKSAAAALQITELQRFAVDQLDASQRLTAWVGSQDPSSAAVCTPIVLVARALYIVSHEGATPDFRPVETRSLVRETLSTPAAHDWLQKHSVAIPGWIGDAS
jgi:tetratricopeptide (TPR) repeat protein